MNLVKYDALIIDPDLQTRMRLKQVMGSVVNFGKVHQLTHLKEGIQKLQGDEGGDVVFISYRFSQEEAAGFIKEAKTTKHGQDSAYILVLKSKDQEGSTIAQSVMMGADGLLFEPYSVDSLVEITVLSARVRKERAHAREVGALRFLLNDMINQVDLIAYSKASGLEVGVAMKKFKDMCGVLKTLEPESFETYLKLAIEGFGNAPLPKAIYQRKKYSGASSRVRRKLAEKLAGDLAKERDEPAGAEAAGEPPEAAHPAPGEAK